MSKYPVSKHEIGMFLMAAGVLGYFYFSPSVISFASILTFVLGFILLLGGSGDR